MEKLLEKFSNVLVISVVAAAEILDDEIRDFKRISKDEKRLKRQRKNNLIYLLLS